MTSNNPATHGTVMPYQRYTDATHAARDQYLATTYHAHRMYLTGPWPDRIAYQTVENTAWQVYYQASRAAWQRYTAEVTPPEPLPVRIPGHTTTRPAAAITCPCCTTGGNDCTCRSDCGASRCQMADPPTGNQHIPIPVYPTDTRTNQEAHASWQPTYTPTDGGNP